jgi:hypothetical protein
MERFVQHRLEHCTTIAGKVDRDLHNENASLLKNAQ